MSEEKFVGKFYKKGQLKKSLLFGKQKQQAFYLIKRLYGTQKIETEFVFNKDDKIEIPKSLEFTYDEKTNKWTADFEEEYY